MTSYKFPGFYSGCCSNDTFWVLSSCSMLYDVRTIETTNKTSHKRDKCNMFTGHGSFLCSVQKTFTPTHLFGCRVASTFSEEKSNIIFPFEPQFVVQ